MNQALEAGIRLFNTQKYFEAHEALEAVWLNAESEEKIFLHGLIQIAAAFHHRSRGNAAGFRSLLEKGWKKLEAFGDARDGLDLGDLRRQLQLWRKFQRESSSPQLPASPPLPRIERTRPS
jgi:predicted metal-dependent hydrolase